MSFHQNSTQQIPVINKGVLKSKPATTKKRTAPRKKSPLIKQKNKSSIKQRPSKSPKPKIKAERKANTAQNERRNKDWPLIMQPRYEHNDSEDQDSS